MSKFHYTFHVYNINQKPLKFLFNHIWCLNIYSNVSCCSLENTFELHNIRKSFPDLSLFLNILSSLQESHGTQSYIQVSQVANWFLSCLRQSIDIIGLIRVTNHFEWNWNKCILKEADIYLLALLFSAVIKYQIPDTHHHLILITE